MVRAVAPDDIKRAVKRNYFALWLIVFGLKPYNRINHLR